MRSCILVSLAVASFVAGRNASCQDSRPTSQPDVTGSRPVQTPADISPQIRSLLESWGEQVADVRSLRVEFEQIKRLKVFRKPRRSRGITLLRGRKLLMQVRDKDGALESELAVAPQSVQLHFPRLKKLEIYPVDKSAQRRPPFPLMIDDIEAIPRDNRLELIEKDGYQVLVLNPKRPHGEKPDPSAVRQVRIRFEKGKMVGVAQTNGRGDRVTLNIHKFEVNPKLSAKDLELVVPAGTETVDHRRRR